MPGTDPSTRSSHSPNDLLSANGDVRRELDYFESRIGFCMPDGVGACQAWFPNLRPVSGKADQIVGCIRGSRFEVRDRGS